jgi:hypothetical protein
VRVDADLVALSARETALGTELAGEALRREQIAAISRPGRSSPFHWAGLC